MKHSSRLLTQGLATFLVGFAILFWQIDLATAQDQESGQPTKLQAKREGGRDPFRKYEPRVVGKRSNLLVPPSLQERIAQYRAQKQRAMVARIPAPKPTTALLLNETTVVGISRTPRGYAAIIEATPIKMSFVIYPGERLYDGQLVAIEDNRLVFRRETVFADGRRERSMEMKPLRQPSSINALSAKEVPSASAIEADKGLEKPTAVDKP